MKKKQRETVKECVNFTGPQHAIINPFALIAIVKRNICFLKFSEVPLIDLRLLTKAELVRKLNSLAEHNPDKWNRKLTFGTGEDDVLDPCERL